MARIPWAVVGVGVAGRARAAAIQRDPRARLVAAHRGRFAQGLEVPVMDRLADAIEAARAVAICSPTQHHAEQARAVLEAGRHCLVEFPLAADPGTASALMALARTRDRVLHVEHIELLDSPSSTLTAHIRPEIVRSIEVRFERPGNPEVDAEDMPVRNVARLHRLLAVAGPIARVEAVRTAPGHLDADLAMRSGATATLNFRREDGLKRKTVLSIHTAGGDHWVQVNGTLTRNGAPQTLLGMGDLFGRDQTAATARILDGTPGYVDDHSVLHVLEVVRVLQTGAPGDVPQR